MCFFMVDMFFIVLYGVDNAVLIERNSVCGSCLMCHLENGCDAGTEL